MATIDTHDNIGGTYMAEDLGGAFGKRANWDRRYWIAWGNTLRTASTDCYPGVMDDFGNLVPVPWHHPPPQP